MGVGGVLFFYTTNERDLSRGWVCVISLKAPLINNQVGSCDGMSVRVKVLT